MAKIGIKKIMIAHHEDVPDVFFDKSGLHPIPNVDFRNINFVQDSASLTDELIEDDNGFFHKINLTFSIRCNPKQIKPFENKPVVIMVNAVDGCNYIIGGKNTPIYITTNRNYSKLSVNEITISCNYQSLDGLTEI